MVETKIKSPSYWPINKEFLNKNSDQRFSLFLKEKNQSFDIFVKFAGPDPVHQGKVRRMLNEGTLESTLYIQKDEMLEYFSQATEKVSLWEKENEGDPDALSKKLHDLCQDIMKGFFEFNVSSKVLRLVDPIMEKMQQCLAQSEEKVLAKTLVKDFSLYTHCTNVGLYCLSFGVTSGMSQEDVHALGLGGLFCDIGMIKVPREIIQKSGPLAEDEEEEVKKHIQYGKGMLAELGFTDKQIIEIIENHHEEFKGGGYPQGISGSQIPRNARICKIMDMYDALTSPRPHRKGYSPIEAFTLMAVECRSQFDPDLLKKFILMMGPSLD